MLIDARLGTVRELAYSLRSVELQFWPRTEVCVLYDLEKDRRFEECLQEFIIKYPYTHPHPISGHVGSRDSRIQLHNLRQSSWWIELEPGDRLAPDFLSRALLSLRKQPELRWIYGDTDLYGFGWRYRPDPKPDWDPIRLLGHNYLQGALLSCSSPEAGESPIPGYYGTCVKTSAKCKSFTWRESVSIDVPTLPEPLKPLRNWKRYGNTDHCF